MDNNTVTRIKRNYGIVGTDSKLDMAISMAAQVAPTTLSILIQGESGVGKDIFSRIIHENSLRKSGKLISINCGAIPEGTIESELFGHVKGSFTGADRDRKGYFEEASGGTIFLDEIGELPLITQVKLLRVLENSEIIPVGANKPIKVDVRIVAATNVDLAAAVRGGRFREDLFFRLQQIPIYIPPLRERGEDIPLLFCKFSSDVAEKYNKAPIRLTPDGREFLMKYPWYGNIRELKNITEQISIVEEDRNIDSSILRRYLRYIPDETLPALVTSQEQNHAITDRELLLKALTMGQMINDMRKEINDLRQAVTHLAQGMPLDTIDSYNEPHYAPSADSSMQIISSKHEIQATKRPTEEVQEAIEVDEVPLGLEEREKEAILKALKKNGHKRRPTAMDLGISERSLYRKLKQYDIDL